MTPRRCCILVLIALIGSAQRSTQSAAALEYDDSVADESIVDSEIASNSYVLPKQIFNDGKPFYLEKNPVSGALDFNTKKTSGLSSPNALDPKADKDITLNNIRTPNFHDFLNLPVKYTSSKFVYPLVSSSYANLKYQGNNKNFISNHKNGTAQNSNTSSHSNNYYSNFKKEEQFEQKPHVNKAAPALLATPSTLPTTTARPTTPVSSTTFTTTRKTSPTTVSTTTTTTTSTTAAPTSTTIQELPTTNKPKFTRPPLKYTTNKYKYSTIRKQPYITMEPSEPLFTKEYMNPTPPTTETESSKFPYTPLAFRPLPAGSTFSTRDPADVYSKMATSTTSRPQPQKKKNANDMSLSELFSSFLDDDEDMSSTTVNSIETTMSVEEMPPGKIILRPFQQSPESARPEEQSVETNRPMQTVQHARPNQSDKPGQPIQSSEPVRPIQSSEFVRPTSESVRPNQITDAVKPFLSAESSHSSETTAKPIKPEERPEKEKVPFFKQEQNHVEANHIVNRPKLNETNESHEHKVPVFNQGQGFSQVQGFNQVQRVQAQPVNQNTVAFTNNMVAPTDNQPIMSNAEGSDPNTFEFGVGYNVPMQPQGFAMRFSTPPPMTPPRVQITEEQLVLRPEMSGTSIRFPVRDNFDNAPIVTGTYKTDINGHSAPPMALPQNGNGLVVFPSNRQQITATVGSDLPAVSMDTSNLVSFGFDKPAIVDGTVSTVENSPANTVKFVNIPLSPSGQPEEVFQVPIQAQMNYPMTGGLMAPAPPPSLPPTQYNQEGGSRPPYNRLHLTPQQKQQLHQHAIQTQQQQQLQQKHPQQQHKQPIRPAQTHNFPQPTNEGPQLDQEQRPPQEPFPVQQNQQQQPPRFNPNEVPRKPAPGNVQRPVIGDRLLPNILPQFRPNAKIGYGPNSYHKDGPENMRPKPQFNNINRRIQPNLQRPQLPQFRRAPPPPAGAAQPPPNQPPNSFNSKMAPLQPNGPSDETNNPNRRYFQVRPNNNERVYNIYPPQQQGPHMMQHPPLNQPLRRFVEGYQPRNPAAIEETSVGVENFQQPQIEINESLGNTQRWTTTIENKADTPPKLEPVVTLQQLQHQKLLQKDGQEHAPTNQFVLNSDAPVAVHSASDKPPIYVVYPVKTSPLKSEVVAGEPADAVVVGQRGEQPPVPPSAEISNSSPAGNEYQNTPFTVIRQEQKPILVVKPKLKFPYPLQRPSADHLINIQPHSDNNPDLYDETSYNIGEEPASIGGRVVNHGPVSADADEEYEINTKLSRNTDRPIAIAYTPTEPSRYENGPDRFSSANYASSVISEIRDGVTLGADPSAAHLHHHRRPINEDTDEFGNPSRGEDYKQEFQAPFYPSVNLDKAPDAVRNSWAVVTPPSVYAGHNQIDRSDNDVEENDRSDKPTKIDRPVTISTKLDASSSGSTTAAVEPSSTEKFNPDKFQPDFQGGFKPIYPPGMKQTPAADSVEEPKPKASNSSIEALVYDDLNIDDKEESTTSN